MSYSLFEIVFKRVYFYAAVQRGITVKENQFGASKITERCKTFIEKEIGIDLGKIERYWKLLVLSQGLRNKIIHHAGTIPAGNKELRKHVRKNPHIELVDPRSRKELIFHIKDQLYIFEFLEISSSYLIWILMRVNFQNQPKRKNRV